MTDFDQLERALSRQLLDVGAAARPPLDSWERFSRRLDSQPMVNESPNAMTAEPTLPDSFGNRMNDQRPEHEMEITMRSKDASSTRRWPLVGAAAGLIAVVVLGLALAARDTDDQAAPAASVPSVPPTVAPTTTAPSALPIELCGAEGNPDAIEAFSAVSAVFEAFNTGDAVGWAIPRAAPGTEVADDELEYVAAAHAAGARYDVAYCDYAGFGEYSPLGGGDSSEPLTGHRFICSTTMTDAFTIAAGIDVEEEFTWLVADGIIIDAVSGHNDVLRSFMSNFEIWLSEEHPDTKASMTTIPFYNYPVADDIPEALALLDEFVTADDR